jgi:two-component sensor histidine kinase
MYLNEGVRPGNHTTPLLLPFDVITNQVQRSRDQGHAKREIYHRVKKGLTVIMSVVAYETRQPGSDARILQAIQGRIVAMAQL